MTAFSWIKKLITRFTSINCSKNQSQKMPLTKPGDRVCSSCFIVEFISAKVEGEEEEMVDNWHHIMIQLVEMFEMWPMDMYRIQDLDFETTHIRVERVWIDFTFSRIKKVRVYIEEVYSDIKAKLIFFVKKKQEMKTLQTLAAETISNCVSEEKDFEHLEVPKLLLDDLNEAYDDIWRVNHKCKNCDGNLVETDFIQCPSNMTHKFCFSCCKNFIFHRRHKFFKQDSEVFCPSGERCPLKGSTLPWTFSYGIEWVIRHGPF